MHFRASRRSLQHAMRAWLLAFGLCALAAAARAQNAAEARELLRAGKTAEAMAKLEQALTRQPADTELRFLRAVVLAEQKRSAEAIEQYAWLIADQPQLPEPYNNLGVLYAGDKQYDKARTAFEMAVRLRPGYAAAHENLADVHAALAGLAYARALELDADNAGLARKLAQTRLLLGMPPPAGRH
ncbi:tetratricopeptide repeat protein [Aquabacterium sp. A7-Y]|uniref:tetratricopeptide repeat protein n=1 Tax=Aquabacterium sp. A7-Y TaxID=1349605 RepID=UPI00223D5E9A|nr:tetratricopeptide repeat protein [Aquabacterium sp. A7-Y]MCW7537793.1 tetratricopeptide repeat protein [Aquabacterium sp. A7-Y]